MKSFRLLVFVTVFLALSFGFELRQAQAQTQAAAPSEAPSAAARVFVPTDLNSLRAEMGKKVIVEGTLVLAGESKSKTVRYLNFTKNWRESVALVFFVGAGEDSFSLQKLRSCVGRKVRATGVLSEYESNLQIQIDSWKQMQAVQ